MAGDEIVARTESPAAASVGEEHDADSRGRDAKKSVERKTFSLHGDGLIDYLMPLVVHHADHVILMVTSAEPSLQC
jgi:hypothetical protein